MRFAGAYSALHWAAENGIIDVAQTLLAAGAESSPEDIRRVTPLHIAARNDHAGAVRVLLDVGADPTALDSIQRTPLEWASNPEVIKILEAAK